MSYQKIFDPDLGQAVVDPASPPAPTAGDRRDGRIYLFTEPLALAVNVAIATGRPLLLRGRPGGGKSSLAAAVARQKQWNYYEAVITARTEAQDLMWRLDAVRRLSDAQTNKGVGTALHPYIDPGVLWWAFQRSTALRRGLPAGDVREFPEPVEPGEYRGAARSVVLIDEIDKADPDVPNNLLVALGSLLFRVGPLSLDVRANDETPPLVVITTNDERDLPTAFLRRCIIQEVPAPDEDRLASIANAHCPGGSPALHREIARELIKMQSALDRAGRPPSTAEYLDAVRACHELKITPASPEWTLVKAVALEKPAPSEGA